MRYRIYFNRANEAPHVWSVDEGEQGSEINVKEVRIATFSRTVVGPPVPESDRRDRPGVWIETSGRLVVEKGVATIYPLADAAPGTA